MRRFFLIILPAFLALVLIAVTGGYYWLKTSLPTTDGTKRLAGLTAQVTVSRTERGLPTIRAETLADGWFALGFVHAQDRLWQMESMRRFALGRLSEVLGAATLDVDRQQRRLGFGPLAKEQYERLAPATRAGLDAYAAGVNAYLDARSGALPPEFVALGYEPEPWLPYHGLLWGRLMAYQLSASWPADLAKRTLAGKVPTEKLQELWPMPGPLPARADAPGLTGVRLPRGASNAWAVAPSLTQGGAALLAGDPHLGLTLPGIWYMARLYAGGHTIEGATAPGTPFVIVGRNRALAWSFTSNEADLQDVVSVRAEGLARDPVDIEVKGEEPYPLTIYRTADGAPVVAGGLTDGSGPDGLALRATALDAADVTPDALLDLNLATGVEAGIRALESFGAPFMNVIMADRSGHIARAHAGVLPERDGDGNWIGLTRLGAGTAVRDPGRGYVANANERTPELSGLDFPVYGNWPEPARLKRIATLLSTGGPFTPHDMTRFQRDTVDPTVADWKPHLAAATLSVDANALRPMMMEWNGAMARDAAQPLIFASWIAEVRRQLFADELPDDYLTMRLPGAGRMLAMIETESAWCDDVTTETVETCARIPGRAFETAIDELSATFGDDPAKWRWGAAHQAVFAHRLLGRIPLLGGLFERVAETPGGDRTLNRGASPRAARARTGFPHVHGAGFRAVHDLGGGPSRYMVTPGQSGNPLSDHYDDLLEPWADGRFVGFDDKRVGVLTLIPK